MLSLIFLSKADPPSFVFHYIFTISYSYAFQSNYDYLFMFASVWSLASDYIPSVDLLPLKGRGTI